MATSCHDKNQKWNLLLSNTPFKNQPVLTENYICFQSDSFVRLCDKNTGKLVRSIPVVNSSLCKPVINNNTLYIISDNISAFNIQENKFTWKISPAQFIDQAMLDSFPDALGYNNSNTNAFIYNNVLLFGNRLGFYALSAQTGEELWRNNYYSASAENLAALSGNNLFLIHDHTIILLDPISGKEKWVYQVNDFLPTNLTTTNDTLIVGGRHALSFLLIRAADGVLLREYTVDDQMYSQPMIANGIMYYTNTVNRLTAVKLRNGSLKWKVDSENDEVDFSPVLYNGKILWSGGSSCHHIYFIDPETGKIINKYYSEDEIIAPLTTDGNCIYYLTTKNLIAQSF